MIENTVGQREREIAKPFGANTSTGGSNPPLSASSFTQLNEII